MQHPDPDELALLALSASDEAGSSDGAGSSADAGVEGTVRTHAEECPTCAAEVDALTRTAALARFEDIGTLPPPPTRVWDAIVAELDLLPTASTASTAARFATPSPVATPHSTAASTPQHDDGARVTPLRVTGSAAASGQPSGPRARFRKLALPLAAAVVGAIAGGAVVWGVRGSGGGQDPGVGGQAAVAATAALAPVPGGPGRAPETGKAQLLKTANGVELHVDSSDLPGIAGSYEVWLLGADGKMVSLGVLSSGAGTFAVPNGIDTAAYGTVDISDEPADGNPAHSKVSVLRGRLS